MGRGSVLEFSSLVTGKAEWGTLWKGPGGVGLGGGHKTLGQEGTLEIRLSNNIVLQKGEQRSKRSVWQAPSHRAGGEAGPRT